VDLRACLITKLKNYCCQQNKTLTFFWYSKQLTVTVADFILFFIFIEMLFFNFYSKKIA